MCDSCNIDTISLQCKRHWKALQIIGKITNQRSNQIKITGKRAPIVIINPKNDDKSLDSTCCVCSKVTPNFSSKVKMKQILVLSPLSSFILFENFNESKGLNSDPSLLFNEFKDRIVHYSILLIPYIWLSLETMGLTSSFCI